MPPKKQKSALQKAKEAILKKKRDASKQKEVSIKKKAFPPGTKQIERANEEEAATRAFFETVIGKSDEDYATALTKFGNDSRAGYGRRQTVTAIIGTLPEDYYQDFAQAYLDQTTAKLAEFWKEFSTQPEVAAAIKEREAMERDAFLEGELKKEKKRRMKLKMSELFGSDSETDEEDEEDEDTEPERDAPSDYPRPRFLPGDAVLVATATGAEFPAEVLEAREDNKAYLVKWVGEGKGRPYRKSPSMVEARHMRRNRRTKTVVIGSDGGYTETEKPSYGKYKYGGNEDPACLARYREMQWIPGRVNQVFLAQAEADDTDNWELPLGEITPYVLPGEPREEDGVQWYRASTAWKKLMCNRMRGSRVQEGDVLTCRTNDGEPVRMRVAYDTTPGGFIVQGEALFQAEQDFLKAARLTKQTKINIILNGPVTPKMEVLAIKKLSQALHRIAPDILDYGMYNENKENKYDTAYIREAIKTILNDAPTSARAFFSRLGDTIVYLQGEEIGHGLFRKRVAGRYYLPQALVTLSQEEKLPEVFEGPRTTQQERMRVASRIRIEVAAFVTGIGKELYAIDNPGERKQTELSEGPLPTLPRVAEWKSACVNREQIEDVPDAQIVYYKEKNAEYPQGAVYCLVIPDIMEEIISDRTPTNPYSGLPLSKAFIKRFTAIYELEAGKEATPKVTGGETPKAVVEKPVVELAPGLLRMMITNITSCEAELDGGDLVNGKCPALDRPPEADEEDDEEDDEEEDDEEDHESDTSSDEGPPPTPPLVKRQRAIEKAGPVVEPPPRPPSKPPPKPDVTTEQPSPTPSTPDSNATTSPEHSPSVNQCHKCSGPIPKGVQLRTKVKSGGAYETWCFCSFKCFEDQKFPKASGGKAGGRKGTKDRDD
jgi:hypothetical protein